MAVYLDLVMGLNFLVDFLLLLGTNRLSGFSPGAGRSALAAVLGAAYSGICLVPGFSFLGNTLWRLVSLGLMGLIAFGMDRSSVKRTVVFVFLSMAMAGVALGFGRRDLTMLILSAVAVWGLCRVGFGQNPGTAAYVRVVITEGERQSSVLALRDSGNTLRDPVTGEQVLILGPETAMELLDLTERQLRNPMETLLEKKIPGLRLLPYRAVGQPGSMLLAKRFSDVRMDGRKGSALVAFAPERIGKGDIYQALAGGMV